MKFSAPSSLSAFIGRFHKGSFIKLTPTLLVRLFWFSGATGLAQLMAAIYSLLLARWLSPEGYGVFAGCYASATVSSFFVNWGMDTWLLHRASIDPHPNQLVGSVLKIKGALGIAWIVAVWLTLTRLYPNFYIPSLFILILVDTWLDACFITLSSFFNATKRTRTVSSLLVIARGLRLFSVFILILFDQSQIIMFVILRLFFTLIAVLVTIRVAMPSWRSPKQLNLTDIWRQSLPFAGSDLLAAIYAQIDVVLLSFLATKAATGTYAPALSMINALITLIMSSYWLFVPHLTQAYHESVEKVKEQFFKAFGILIIIGSGITLLVAVFGPRLTDIALSNAFKTSGELLRMMSPILFFKSISAACAALLVAADRQSQRLIPQLISAGANLMLNLWAIPHWGPAGAAMVYLASELILTFGYSARAIIFLRQLKRTWRIPIQS